MRLFAMMLVFLPITWGSYALSRWILNAIGLPSMDQIALSALAGIVGLASSIILGWELMQKERRG
jgi:hypothetical protein